MLTTRDVITAEEMSKQPEKGTEKCVQHRLNSHLERARQNFGLIALRATRLAIHLDIDRLQTLDLHFFRLEKARLLYTPMLSPLHNRQKLQSTWERNIAYDTDVEPAIGMVGSGIDAKTTAICWSVADRK